MKLTEKLIEESIIKWLNLQFNCYAFKMDVKGTWDPQRKFFRKVSKNVALGGSDIICCFKGRFISIEVKSPEAHKRFFNNPGAHELRQQGFMSKVKSAQGLAYVVSSLDEVRELFQNWMKLSH